MSRNRGYCTMELVSLLDTSKLHSHDSQHDISPPEAADDGPHLTLLQRFITNWLIMDPSLLEKYQHPKVSKKKKKKNYQVQKQEELKYIYFFGGRFRSIKTKPISVLTGLIIFAGGVLVWIFEASWLWHNILPAMVLTYTYFWYLTARLYIKSATSDPGIIPRNIHLPKSIENGQIKNPPDEYFNTVSLPYKTRGRGVQVKYCSTCHVWRPPRTSHCSICEVCILNHDHHCIYLNNCIGERNYKFFLWFLLLSSLTCVYTMIITMVHLCHYRWISNSDIPDFAHSIVENPASLFIFIYACLAFVYPFGLLCFHVYLTAYNITTREYLNYVYKKNKNTNPFVNVFTTHSLMKNWYINWLGKSSGVALVRPREKYTPGDIRFESIAPLEMFLMAVDLST